MKRILIFSFIVLFASCTSQSKTEQTDFIKDYLERLENSRKYLVLVAEEMPEDKYGFKATPESMSFAENLMHITWAMDWHCQSLLGERKARDWNTDNTLKVANKSKAEMIATINKTFDETIKFIKEFDTSKFNDRLDYLGLDRSKRQILLLLSDHVTHHRAQILVYLRLNGIKPPRYVLYQ
ncbi:DinB family protein [Polaribacter haliotis]|uniref:DinB family protein n=1 Tax=Polaribacter haliotis TaxID=1888915 RepID=A0A7L8ACW0_9FLAO|nr:DinB family protein [Polaribacter haliotis]QOD59858.1 DinB family protein [Polaribacter haliotis]